MKKLRIGVICEGPTDFHAIRHFMGPSLEKFGIEATFVDIQPDMGKTLPDAGWGNIELWLKRNPPDFRVRQYFGGGLFEKNLFSRACDIFLLQMDSDILEDIAFRNHMLKEYGVEIPMNIPHQKRGLVVIGVLELWSSVDKLTLADARRHVFAPAVESTETWCVAAFSNKYASPENLSGADLVQAFMESLETSEGLGVKQYVNVNKDVERRERFCGKHSMGYERILTSCPHFERAVGGIVAAVELRPDTTGAPPNTNDLLSAR